MLNLTILLSALGILCLLSAAISALETALLCLKEHQLKSLAGNSDALRRAIRLFLREPRAQINHVILLSTPLHLAIAAIILYLLHSFTFPWQLQPFVTALLLFGAVIVLTELVPTLIGISQPAAVFRLTARPLHSLNPILNPIAKTLLRFTDRLTTLFLSKKIQPRGDFTEEELGTLIEVRQEEGILDEGEADVIHEILKLSHKTAKDCMTPRVDAVVMSAALTSAEIDEFIHLHHHRYIPAWRDSPDTIVGILDVRTWLTARGSSIDTPPRTADHIRLPVFVPETMPALDVFKNFLTEPRSLVIVLDEFGGLEGVISQTDIIEEIIGDAAPHPEQQLEIQDLGKDRLLVAGSARLDEIGEILDLDLESEGLDTIAGLLINAGDRLPAPGEIIKIGGVVATIRRCSARRVEEVLIEKMSHPTPKPRS